MSLWRWTARLPRVAEIHRLELGAGDTPVLHSRTIGPRLGLRRLTFKLESVNPSGSYKDRFAAVAVSHMLAIGQARCLATSSGNTGSALAAYCAAAHLPCEILSVCTVPDGKLDQMRAYGAEVHKIDGFGPDLEVSDAVFRTIRELAERHRWGLQISAFACSPIGMAGVKTIAYELAEQSPGIDHVFVPVGGGGLALAIARGFGELAAAGELPRGPRIECVQPEGNNTVAGPLRDGAAKARAVAACTSDIGGLQVPSVLDGDDLLREARATGGTGHVVTDERVWEAQAMLAREEGVYCEPAGAVALAGVMAAVAAGELASGASVVCIVTGSGFKDPQALLRDLPASVPTVSLADWREGKE